MSKYGVICGPYFPVFGPNTDLLFSLNTGKYGPEITPYLDTFAFSPNTGKYRPEITPYLDTFHAAPVHIKRHNVCRDIRYVSSVLTLLVIF